MQNELSCQAKRLFFLGWTLVYVGAMANEWVLVKTFSSDGILEFDTRVMIWLFDVILILLGCVLVNYRKLTYLTRATLTLSQSYPRTLALGTGVVFATFTLLCTEAVFFAFNNYKQRKAPRVEYSESGRLFDMHDELLGFKHLTNVQVSSMKKVGGKIAYNVTYSTDEYGRRRVPVNNPDQRNKFIAFFGCSFTFGEGVNDNETLPFYVGQIASDYMPYNYGVMGYGAQGMLAKLESDDVVNEMNERDGMLIYTFIDDHYRRAAGTVRVINDWGRRSPYYVIDSQGILVRNGTFASGRPIFSSLSWLIGKSEIAEYFGIEYPRINDDHIKLTAEIIEESRDRFQQQFHSDNFYVLFYPGTKKGQEMIPYFENAGIRYLDYSQLLNPNDPQFRLDGDPHPTPKAFKIIAEALARDIGILNR
jgi:hypothetical protein